MSRKKKLHKALGGVAPPIFGKRHYKRFAACVKSLNDPQERTMLGVFACAVFIEDNAVFDKEIFLREAGVLK